MTYANAAYSRSKTLIDMYGNPLYTAGQTEEPMNIDNLIDITGMSRRGNDMPRKWVTIGEDEQGKLIKKNVYGRTESELILKAAQLMRENERIAKKKTLFKEFVEKWFEVKEKKDLAKNTFRSYGQALKKHILPTFGERYIEDICTQDIQDFMNDKKEYARSSVELYWTIIKDILKLAKEEKVIEDNPAVSMQLSNPSKKENKRKALSKKQMADIAQNIHKLCPQDRCLVALLMTEAARKGEALALRWEDIDFENNRIRIDRQVDLHNRCEIKDPKRGSKGIVPLPEWTKEILLPYRQESGYIIYARKGRPISEKTYGDRIKRIRKTINLYGATAHIFRHTAITAVCHSGTNVANVQAFARHKHLSTTLNYIHEDEDEVQALGGVFDEIVKKNKNTSVA